MSAAVTAECERCGHERPAVNLGPFHVRRPTPVRWSRICGPCKVFLTYQSGKLLRLSLPGVAVVTVSPVEDPRRLADG